MTTDKNERVRAAIAELTWRGVIDENQAAWVAYAVAPAVTDEPNTGPAAHGPRTRLAEILGYVGGAVTAGAAMLLVGQSWDDLGRLGRIGTFGVMTLALLVAGVFIGGATPSRLLALRHPEGSAQRRLVSTLFTLAGLAAAGVGWAVTDHGSDIAASLAALVVVLAGYALVPSLFGQLGTWFAAVATITSIVGTTDSEHSLTLLGTSLVVFGVVWAGLSRVGAFAESHVAPGLAAAVALYGAQLVLFDDQADLAYVLTASVAVACFVGFALVRNWLVLATGSLAVVLVVPEALYDWTQGGIGVTVLLLVAGAALLGASGLGLRLGRRASRA